MLVRGGAAALGALKNSEDVLRGALLTRYGAASAILTDSGTSALILALRLVAGGLNGVRPARIACPAFVCVDVGAAAVRAGVELVLYDTDPRTLSPDVESLLQVLSGNVDAVLVAHLFGYPVAMSEMRDLCRSKGIPLIEDAAQEAGAQYRSRHAGSFGDVAVVSFGRGKGVAGGGGALIRSPDSQTSEVPVGLNAAARRGWGELLSHTAQWMLGRPSLYWVPLSIPALQLGEMVYRFATEPRAMSCSSAAMVSSAIELEENDMQSRRANVRRLLEVARGIPDVAVVEPVPGAEPSFLRFPLRDLGRTRSEAREAGVMRGYPRLLHEDPNVSRLVRGVRPEDLPGATELRDTLFTLPTHSLLKERDFRALSNWMRGRS
jgi:dTDP-4-amino-4,6-dideoxygalactose transaminase